MAKLVIKKRSYLLSSAGIKEPTVLPEFLAFLMDTYTRDELRLHAKRLGIQRGRSKADTALNLIQSEAVGFAMSVRLCIPIEKTNE